MQSQFTRIVFDPQGDAPQLRDELNLFQGYRIDHNTLSPDKLPMSRQEQLLQEVKPVVQHIHHIWCRGDSHLAQYVIRWLASVVQKPWQKTRVALLLRSRQEGAGKGVIMTLLSKIFGTHYKSLPLERVTGRFNAQLQDVLMLFLDETTWGGNHKV